MNIFTLSALFVAVGAATFGGYRMGKSSAESAKVYPFCIKIQTQEGAAPEIVQVEPFAASTLTRFSDGASIDVPALAETIREKEKANVVACPQQAGK